LQKNSKIKGGDISGGQCPPGWAERPACRRRNSEKGTLLKKRKVERLPIDKSRRTKQQTTEETGRDIIKGSKRGGRSIVQLDPQKSLSGVRKKEPVGTHPKNKNGTGERREGTIFFFFEAGGVWEGGAIARPVFDKRGEPSVGFKKKGERTKSHCPRKKGFNYGNKGGKTGDAKWRIDGLREKPTSTQKTEEFSTKRRGQGQKVERRQVEGPLTNEGRMKERNPPTQSD